MISRLTKIQLILFVIVTVLGTSFVGARYAQIDRLFVDRTFPVTVELTESGGIFAGAEVTYRGIAVGKVDKLTFTSSGVRATLDIEKSAPRISADAQAVVANKSAIGEQYLDLRPQGSGGPYLKAGSKIGIQDTQVPIDTRTLLTNLNAFVGSVPTDDLNTVVTELGTAFDGAGPALAEILDSTSNLVQQAQDNLDVTRSLINSSSTVLQTQIDKGSEIQSFASDLALFTDTLVSSDGDLRRLIDDGSGAAQTINAVVSENSADLSAVLANLQGPVRVLDENVAGLQSLFLLYPYLIQGAYSVAVPNADGSYNAAFGNILGLPAGLPGGFSLCQGPENGYRDIRLPSDVGDLDALGQEIFRTDLGCTDPNLVPRASGKSELSRTVVPTASTGKGDLEWLLLGTNQ
ncbi:MCE family protein [Aeromicrobium sp. Leaf350]|uniref:MCE family protein n=1 Tax=Aeromicrobium sp. Leaf350 TaxID=2876565 RepID=UPI001E364D97|nr:MlaD family protein [Aeromicrobium sp. Leaf350]